MSRLVPKLRFKEFSGEWEEKTIADIGNFYYGKSAPKWSLEENAQTKCVRYGELYTKFGVMITNTYSRTNIDPKKLRFSKGGEILVPRVGERPEEFGKCCSYLPLKNIAIGEMISVFETKQNPLFYTYYFRNLWIEFSKVVEGQNVKNLYYKELEPLKIYKPTLSEQQKIANTLSSLDSLIEAQQRKVETLQKHKKGLMQQLFPSDGENEPKLRFKEFSGEWDKKPINKILTIGSGRDYKHLSDGNIPVYGTGGYMLSVNDYLYDGESVCVGRKGTIDKPMFLTGKFWTVDTLFYTHSFKDNIPKFIYALFLKINWYKYNEASGVPSLSKITIGKIDIYIPTPKEQQKIANTLSSLDNLIEATKQKVEALQKHKKGLMQQMFVSGED